MRNFLFFLSVFVMLISPPAFAQQDDFNVWRTSFYQQALRDGISEATIRKAMPYITYNGRVIELDQKQPESTQTYAQYLAATVTAGRVSRARQEFQNNYENLIAIERVYNVPAEIIIALWAKESDFGRIQGNFNILSSLGTLAYDGRRKSLFESELLAALRFMEQENIDPKEMLGSWAGAMGQCQFIPTSVLKYAVDGNADGQIDLRNSLPDVFASIANYLSKNGWEYGVGVAQEVNLPANFNPIMAQQKLEKPVTEWHALGVVRPTGADLYLSGAPATLLQPDGEGSQAYLAYSNYRVLMRWNRSTYFALAIAKLADQINPKFKAPRK
ncbi:MAG TPA: lytic murein transglycosylase [Rhodospirillaceae bacterium]|nr:lytic murein transglycosylase [Rhodospirillaceae bacterium]